MISDVYVLGLSNVDAILGIQWLESLECYVQDFKKIPLEFMIDGKKTMLKAMLDGGP